MAILMSVLPQSFPHGGGIEAAAQTWHCHTSDILDVSTGLHPAGQPAWLGAWMQEHAKLAAIYPDKQGEPARSILAHDLGVSPEHVLMIAGAQAAIEIIFQAMSWQSLAIQVPCYNEPIRCAQRAGCDVLAFERGLAVPQADVLWWTSPNNPLGEKMPMPICSQRVLDESYMVFSERRTLGVLSDTIRLGSLTKTFCIPGLRLGYVVAEETVIERLSEWLPPWASSTFALHLLEKLLPEADARDQQIQDSRLCLEKLFTQYGWQYEPSQASFILAKPPHATPDFASHHILVRSFPEWPQLKGWLRFGFPHQEKDWQRLEAALCPSR
ncbi:MAG: aminotransferase class I/II-fold pyridoxal phosphate-dependent enzyme [Zetaproteobacteria bacterium]|nr:aminotransferase class I/II-fold pyridoxal phosphate-dependent enzyme [Zetaproteobacteria bacterium]